MLVAAVVVLGQVRRVLAALAVAVTLDKELLRLLPLFQEQLIQAAVVVELLLVAERKLAVMAAPAL
jgi:hypothetical protein